MVFESSLDFSFESCFAVVAVVGQHWKRREAKENERKNKRRTQRPGVKPTLDYRHTHTHTRRRRRRRPSCGAAAVICILGGRVICILRVESKKPAATDSLGLIFAYFDRKALGYFRPPPPPPPRRPPTVPPSFFRGRFNLIGRRIGMRRARPNPLRRRPFLPPTK